MIAFAAALVKFLGVMALVSIAVSGFVWITCWIAVTRRERSPSPETEEDRGTAQLGHRYRNDNERTAPPHSQAGRGEGRAY